MVSMAPAIIDRIDCAELDSPWNMRGPIIVQEELILVLSSRYINNGARTARQRVMRAGLRRSPV